MPIDLSVVVSPQDGMYRLAIANPGPFAPRPWKSARPDGTYGNRFDDPAIHLPVDQRFQVIYCASQRHVVFGETLASLRPSLLTLDGLANIEDDEPVEDFISRSLDPGNPQYGLVRADWRLRRVVGHTILDPQLQFADLSTARSSQHLRQNLAKEALAHGATDIDQSLLMESNRGFTRQVARYIYEQTLEDGTPRFAGIRYISRHDSSWVCWAVFADRVRHVPGMPGIPETIFPDDPDLLEIAGIFGLTIEVMSGHEGYYRP